MKKYQYYLLGFTVIAEVRSYTEQTKTENTLCSVLACMICSSPSTTLDSVSEVGADVVSDDTKRPFHTILIYLNLLSHV